MVQFRVEPLRVYLFDVFLEKTIHFAELAGKCTCGVVGEGT